MPPFVTLISCQTLRTEYLSCKRLSSSRERRQKVGCRISLNEYWDTLVVVGLQTRLM